MKKKILFTSLLVAAGAFALASCSKKSVKTDTEISSTEEVSNTTSVENNEQNENNTSDSNVDFFDDNSFELKDDFSDKDLSLANLSLKDQILLQSTMNALPTGFDSSATNYTTIANAGIIYNGEITSKINGHAYSNDVVDAYAKLEYKGDQLPYNYSPYSKKISLPAEPELKLASALDGELIKKAPVSVSRQYIPPMEYMPMIKDFELNLIGYQTKNYQFIKTTDYVNGSKHTSNDIYQSSTPLTFLLESLVLGNSSHGYSNPTYYQYDKYVVMVASYTDSDRERVETGYDYNTDTTLYTDAFFSYEEKYYTFFEKVDNSFRPIYTHIVNEEKSNVIYDNEFDEYINLGETKTINKTTYNVKVSYLEKEYDKKNELVDSFKTKMNVLNAYTDEHSLTESDEGTSLSSGSSSYARYQVISSEFNKINLDVAFSLDINKLSKFCINLETGELDSKVINDELTTDRYSTTIKNIELDLSKYLADKATIVTYQDVDYIKNKSTDKGYTIIVNVDLTNTKDGVVATINDVEFIENPSSYLVIDSLK